MVLPTIFGGIMTKSCSKCKSVKDISMFYRNKYKTDGRQTHCKVCHNEVNMAWRKANPDKYSKYNCTPRRNKAMKLKSKLRSRQHRLDMTDRYIRDILTMHTDLKLEDIPDDLVELHKANLALKRELGLTQKIKGRRRT